MRWNDGLTVRPPRMRRNVLGATKYATNILPSLPSCHRSLIPDGSTERGRRHLKQMNLMGSKVHVNRRRTVRKTAKPDTPSIADSPLRILPIRHELYAMASWAQSSQRTTWPPRAAVRQFSIADIAFNWPRHTWPALASRQAWPWPRKISATSRAGRDTCVVRQAGGSGALMVLRR